MDISEFDTDVEAVEGGRWVDNIPGRPGIRLKVRGLDSQAFDYAISRIRREAPREDRDRDGISLKPEADRAAYYLALHEAILLDWDGLSSDGQQVVYDAALAKKWLTDPKRPKLRNAVVWAARVVDNEMEIVNKAIEKN